MHTKCFVQVANKVKVSCTKVYTIIQIFLTLLLLQWLFYASNISAVMLSLIALQNSNIWMTPGNIGQHKATAL